MPSVSAFWGDREVSKGTSAEVVSSVLFKIGAIDPSLAAWRKKGRSRKQAATQPVIDTRPEGIEALLRVNRKDVGREAIPELGFSFSAWNGANEPDEEATVSATIGLHAANANLRNAFVVTLPASWEERDPRFQSLAAVLVECLTPDEVVLFGRSGHVLLWSRK